MLQEKSTLYERSDTESYIPVD